MATQTSKLKLTKPAEGESADIDVLNANFDVLDNVLPLSGGTLTGNLNVGSSSIGTNGYIEGTWLKTTAAGELATASQIAVLSGGWIYYITPANLKTLLSTAAATVTLTKAGWTGSEGSYSQTISVTGVTASNDVEVGVASSASEEAWLQATSQRVRCTAQEAGKLTFKAHYKPTVDIPIVVRVL